MGEEYRLFSSSLCSFLHSHVTSSLLDPNNGDTNNFKKPQDVEYEIINLCSKKQMPRAFPPCTASRVYSKNISTSCRLAYVIYPQPLAGKLTHFLPETAGSRDSLCALYAWYTTISPMHIQKQYGILWTGTFWGCSYWLRLKGNWISGWKGLNIHVIMTLHTIHYHKMAQHIYVLSYLTSYHITYLIIHNISYIYIIYEYKPISFNEELLGRGDSVSLAVIWPHCDANYVHKEAISPFLVYWLSSAGLSSHDPSTSYDLIWDLLPIHVSDVLMLVSRERSGLS
jgi:hypothetical protein